MVWDLLVQVHARHVQVALKELSLNSLNSALMLLDDLFQSFYFLIFSL